LWGQIIVFEKIERSICNFLKIYWVQFKGPIDVDPDFRFWDLWDGGIQIQLCGGKTFFFLLILLHEK